MSVLLLPFYFNVVCLRIKSREEVYLISFEEMRFTIYHLPFTIYHLPFTIYFYLFHLHLHQGKGGERREEREEERDEREEVNGKW